MQRGSINSLETSCPNEIHLIWFGSLPRKTHTERIREWKRLNPHYTINLIVDLRLLTAKDQRHLLQYSNDQEINLLDLNQHKKTLVDEEDRELLNIILTFNTNKKGITNYAVTSDIMRALILKKRGGLYFDLDITPQKSLPLDISLPLQFRYYVLANWFNYLSSQSPCVMMSSPHSIVIKKIIEVLKLILAATDLIQHHANSTNARIRKLAATYSTGSAIEIALMHLLYEGSPCFKMGMLDKIYIRSGLYNKMQALVNEGYYRVDFEESYVRDENKEFLPGIKNEELNRDNAASFEQLKTKMVNIFYNAPDTILLQSSKTEPSFRCSLLSSSLSLFSRCRKNHSHEEKLNTQKTKEMKIK